MEQTCQGSCHCGEVRFEADLDLALGTIRCNCSICTKLRFWPAIVKPEAFRLLAGAASLSLYQFSTGTDEHFFCKHCGVHAFGKGNSPRWGKFYAVSVTCLNDVSDQALAAAPITYLDGRHDNWDRAPAETSHL